MRSGGAAGFGRVVPRRAAVLGILSAFALAGERAGAASDAILVIVHKDNPIAALDRNELTKIFLTKRRSWSSGDPIEPWNLPSDSATRQDFDQAVHGFDSDEAKRYWIDRKIRGGAAAPPQLPSSSAIVGAVAAGHDAIGYVQAATPLAGVKVVARIVNGNVVGP